MNKNRHLQVLPWKRGARVAYLAFLFLLLAAIGLTGLVSSRVQAATGINEQVNFQGRLLDSSGAVVADGDYNMRFKIYQDGDGALGGGDETLKWTEERKQTNRVRVKNGYFSVMLGSVTAFSGSVDWDQSVLWLSLDIGGTADTPTPTYDGEMDPFKRLGAAPYALNAGKLGGLTSAQFVQLQASSPGTQQTGNINVSGTIIGATALQSALLDTASAGTLSLGTTNATAINLNQSAAVASGKNLTFTGGASGFDQSASSGTFKTGTGTVSLNGNTTVASGKSLTANGTALFQNNADSTTAFQIQDAAGTSNLFVADTTNSSISIAGAIDNNYKLYVNGATRLRNVVAGGTAGNSTLVGATGNGGSINLQNAASEAFAFQSFDNTTASNIFQFNARPNSTSENLLQIQRSSAEVFTINNSGGVLSKNSTNSTTAFRIQNAAGNNYLSVNTSGAVLTLGDTSIASTVNVGNSSGAVTQTINIGRNATASSVTNLNLGSGIGSSSVIIDSGTGGINIGTNAVAKTVTVGSLTGASATTVQGGTAGVNLGTGGIANTIQIGNTTGAVAQTVNIGNNATASSTGTVVIGNLLGTSTTTIQGGTGNINLKSGGNIVLGTSDTTGTLLVLDTKTGSGDPTGVNGGIYYNSNSAAFRCYQNGAWANFLPNIDSASGGGGSTSSTSYVSTGAPAVTLNTGTSALVTIEATHYSSTIGCNAYISVAVSGATTIAASDANGLVEYDKLSNYLERYSRTFKLTGLTAGSNTFTQNYRVGGGCTGVFGSLDITVQALP